ncbi:MAG: S-layer homology domain-containing protein [Clostridia bacterium]|nr:S-layer homology domain-containing protein [Clostridia bacterium]
MRLKSISKVVSLILTTVLLITNSSFAQVNRSQRFTDVSTDHWAFEAVSAMTERQILSGYSDHTFKPDHPVSRAEFAKIMVLALNLPLKSSENGTFRDVPKEDWAFKYVESAKFYLTGFRTASGDLFKPAAMAVREDMAVGLVKALKLENEASDESKLNAFVDKDGISSNLKRYVTIAVKHGIMKGSTLSNSSAKAFNPQGILTRAEAAVLLYNVMNTNEEKVTYDQDSKSDNSTVPMEDERNSVPYAIPSVTAAVENGKVVVRWQAVHDQRFQYYKVVVSKNNPYPRYPEDGYLYVISDSDTTQAVVDNREAYKGGDFGEYLTPGCKYYFSVTAVYNDIKLPGNVVQLTYPGRTEEPASNYDKPQVKAEVVDGKVVIRWNAISGKNFNYYKVVVSKYNSSPRYPNDGYQTFFTDQNKTSCTVQAGDGYNGGDFGGEIESGETYYFSITAVFGDRKIAGNAVKLKVP